MTTQCSKYAGIDSVQDIVEYFMRTRGLNRRQALELAVWKLRTDKIPDIIKDTIQEVTTICP